ncbi:hypothetical protein [Enterococcus sp. DIV0800]|uniref:hypothetical protein n=1 Tax=unclassified Enterococcus TaxID=2608891 RepID=UPI003D2FB5B0
MAGLQIATQQLESIALNVADVAQLTPGVAQLSSNVGDIGMAPDYSKNALRNQMQDQHPLLTWLLNTPLSVQMRNASRQGLAQLRKDHQANEWRLQLPYTVGTLPPTDTTGECCWVPLDITKCGADVPLRLLCLKDCDQMLDNLINNTRQAGSNDLTGAFLRPGETVLAARKRMARASMAFFTAYNMILGVTSGGTQILKPFHGLLEVLEDPSIIKIVGTNTLAAFDSIYARLQFLGGGNHVFAVHPLTYQGIASLVQPGRNGSLPEGWTKNGDSIVFHGISFIQDKIVPADVTGGVGEVWLLEGNSTGAYTGTNLAPTDNFIRHSESHTNDPDQGCASECDYYYNYGAAFNNNSNMLAVVTDVPLNAAALGSTLQGLDGLIHPTTLVPMD